ncbi:penicillin-binding protein 2 [Psychromarinibacter halotolerans]|uniref:Penicillin-binding protein 2 n=1 Tax=Psychromarinibacter halotolerans TaxID=1775175 RepID=A0ABV7GZ40_9RHOB|nr:penicillin-binding protein 2 [Psychromarinibacter halotolerans]MDF0598397.1 penicillin-binding protein 2 [Psychromarinibacter halotolerans]
MRRTPKDTEAGARKVSRRGFVLGGAMAAFAALLTARMRYMQVDQADQFRLLADENRINIRLIAPSRGLIYDRNGVILAENEQNYRVVMVKEDAGDVEEVLGRLQRIIKLPEEELERVKNEIDRRSPFVPVTVADRLSWEAFSEVAVNAPALPGVSPEVGQSRIYPMDRDFAHIVGYVGPVSDYDLTEGYLSEDEDPVLQIPKFQVGKTGVEARMEHDLRGQAGTRRIEVNAQGRVMRELDRVEGGAGDNVQMTIDSALQNYIQVRLGEESASAVVMDCGSGDILGIASAPSFDPNLFVRGISVPDYRALLENDHRPLSNKTVQGAYPPGSTFKMVVALAALEDGVIDREESIFCGGYKELGQRRFHCWRRGGHGRLSLSGALEQSCDVYFYEIAERVGIEKITAMARRLGLGQRHDVPLSAVVEGLTPTKAWKRENRDADWLIGDTLNAGIGQGFVLASPLQLAVMTSRIATGRALTPRLIKSINAEEIVQEAGVLDIDPDHLNYVREGMWAVTNGRHGSARSSRVVADGMELAGKTGTSQVRNITAAERARGVTSNDDLPWNRRDHALFVCYAPYDRPQVACSVVVEHGGGGSAVAAPIARDIMLQALYGGTPPLDAYPSSQRGTIRTRQQELPLRDPSSYSGGKIRA